MTQGKGRTHRLLDDDVIVGYLVFVDWLGERPGRGRVLHVGQDMLHDRMLRTSKWSPRADEGDKSSGQEKQNEREGEDGGGKD